MEIVDNAIILIIPGAMEAGLGDIGFWAALAFALLVAGAAAYPVNRWLLARGKGTPSCTSITHTRRRGPPSPRARARRVRLARLAIALALIVGFMCVEVVVGILADSLALLSDAAHMLTDAGALAPRAGGDPAHGARPRGDDLRARAQRDRGGGDQRHALLVLGLLFVFESVRRLIDPHPVEGAAVLIVAVVGVS